MFQDHGRHPEGRLTADYVVDDRRSTRRLDGKRVPEPELRNTAFGGRYDLGHHEHEDRRVTFGEIPAVGLQLVMHVVDESTRPIERDLLLPAGQNPQQAIEADEMVDMSMRHEHVVEAVNLSRRERRDIAEVEENRALLQKRFNIKRRGAGPPGAQTRGEGWARGGGVVA